MRSPMSPLGAPMLPVSSAMSQSIKVMASNLGQCVAVDCVDVAWARVHTHAVCSGHAHVHCGR